MPSRQPTLPELQSVSPPQPLTILSERCGDQLADAGGIGPQRGTARRIVHEAVHEVGREQEGDDEGVEGLRRPIEQDPAEQRELAPVLLLREHGDGTTLSERLDHLHARHDRVAGEMAGAVLFGDGLLRDDPLAGNELRHLVDQQHRIAVRQHRFDRSLIHQAESLALSPLRPRWA